MGYASKLKFVLKCSVAQFNQIHEFAGKQFQFASQLYIKLWTDDSYLFIKVSLQVFLQREYFYTYMLPCKTKESAKYVRNEVIRLVLFDQFYWSAVRDEMTEKAPFKRLTKAYIYYKHLPSWIPSLMVFRDFIDLWRISLICFIARVE